MSNKDFSTKVLLFAIAIALWGLLLKPFVSEIEVAQAEVAPKKVTEALEKMLRKLEEVYGLKGTDLVIVLLQEIRSGIRSIKLEVEEINSRR